VRCVLLTASLSMKYDHSLDVAYILATSTEMGAIDVMPVQRQELDSQINRITFPSADSHLVAAICDEDAHWRNLETFDSILQPLQKIFEVSKPSRHFPQTIMSHHTRISLQKDIRYAAKVVAEVIIVCQY